MEAHLSSLQDIVRLTIRQELEWSERRFKRITMSHDASDNPAELYGADGEICYRKAGGVGVPLGTVGADGLYGTLGADFILYGSASDDLTFVKFLEWDHDTNRLSTQTETFTLGHDNTSAALSTGFYFYRGTDEDKEASLAWNETADRFEFLEEVGVTSAKVLLESLLLVSEPTQHIGTIKINDSTGNMEFADENTTTKTLAELAAGGGGVTAHSALTELDYASAGHTGFAGNPLTASLDVAGYFIDNVFTMQASSLNGITIQDDGGTIRAYLANSGDSCHHFSWPIDMNSQKITNLGAGTPGTSDAARMSDLGGGGVTDHGALTGLADDDHTQYLLVAGTRAMTGDFEFASPGYNILGVKVLSGALGADFEIWGSNSGGGGSIPFLDWDRVTELLSISHLAAGTVDGEAVRYEQLAAYLLLAGGTMSGGINMNGEDITEVGEISGTSGVPLKIEFKGTTAYRIYVDGTTPYYNRYETPVAHEFDIGSTAICYVASDGITMAAGKKIKSVAANDLILQAPSGKMIKFVIG